MRSVFFIVAMLLCFSVIAQKGILNEIQTAKTAGILFDEVTPFELIRNIDERGLDIQKLENASFFNLNKSSIHNLRLDRPAALSFSIDGPNEKKMLLELVEHNPFSPDFQLFASDSNTPVPYDQGIHYRGIVNGDINSIVSMSFFNDEIYGMISTSSTNYTIGKMDIPREEIFVIFEEEALGLEEGLYCQTPYDGRVYTSDELKASVDTRDNGDCVRLYIEIDDDVVTDKGGAIPASNFTTALFNELITLYANENIAVSLSEIYAWTSSSPYSGSTSSAMLSSFQMYTGSFNGDLAHLVSYKASGGIAAGFAGICNSNPDESKCFSSISATYSSYPAYSWSVMVITHEMGHLLGSRHTHACVWNGNGTAIDGCAGATEGSCSLPGNPSQGGTIMSYCHLTSVGINPSLGFGSQPGTVIRNTVNAPGNCLSACSGPPPPASYCASSGNNQNYEFIQSISLGSISNNSGNNSGYGDFTAQSTSLNAGSEYNLVCTPGFGGSAYTEYWSVWIDYNNDMDFDDPDELLGQGSGSSVVDILFTIPANSPILSTRMRVSMSYGGYPSTCGSFSYGEVEDYTVSIIGGAVPTCNDGIQNGGETGIDCGGEDCPECTTCDDGIQNGDETGVDCGGSLCPACPTCDDGIQNGDETGVDCGGSTCPACPTCDDGIQNGDETSIDCGGSCDPCPGGSTVVFGHYFESGWDGWSDGGSDCARYNGSRSWEGSYSLRIRDNSGVASATTSSAYNVSGFSSLDLKFYFYAYSMETGEDFWLRYYDGSSWFTVAAFVSGTSFSNGGFYTATVNISAAVYNMATDAKFRFQCDASANYDLIYIDEVTLTGNTGTALPGQQITIEELESDIITFTPQNMGSDDERFEVYPNPTKDVIRLDHSGELSNVAILSSSGILIKKVNLQHNNEIDLSDLNAGLYLILADHEGERVYKRIIKY